MEDEEIKKPEDKEEVKEEVKEDAKDTKGVSIVDEARAIRDEIKKEREMLKTENEKKEKLQSEELLSSSAGGKVEATPPKEETPKEYKDRVMSGELND
ncbi:MAG TPA: hypothetical protein ENI23_16610 [bacterium]|nr:hypothetical protein [bacterium]